MNLCPIYVKYTLNINIYNYYVSSVEYLGQLTLCCKHGSFSADIVLFGNLTLNHCKEKFFLSRLLLLFLLW